ncbi:suppressor of fused domain protein [Deinococcus radiophilus]
MVNGLGERWLDHFMAFLGEYDEVRRYPGAVGTVQVLSFPQAITECVVFASLGFSRLHPETEVYTVADTAFDVMPDLLGNILTFWLASGGHSLQRGMWLEISAILSPDFITLTGKTAVYFTAPHGLPESFTAPALRPVQMILISAAELEMLRCDDVNAFEDMLEAQEVDVFDLRRPSL